MPDRVVYQFEYDEHLRCAFIGAGGHSFRNVYPALQYAPVELVAVCDVEESRADAYRRAFGASRHYTDHHTMLADVRPEAVFIVTSYDEATGRVQATDIAIDCMRAGAHVWMEKPAAASVAEVEHLRVVAAETGRTVVIGLKKLFTPAFEKVQGLIDSPAFGPVSSIYVRYPESLPAPEHRHDLKTMQGFLDHIYHPVAVLTGLLGPVHRFGYEWESRTGASVATMTFGSGAIGTLHLAGGSAHTSPLERVEVVGHGANVVIDNGVRVIYYRSGGDREYGRSSSYLVDDAAAPLIWEPEFSLGQLYNKNLFYLGYVQEILHFCASVQSGQPPTKGTLDDALAIMHVFEAYQQTPPGTTVTLPIAPEPKDTA